MQRAAMKESNQPNFSNVGTDGPISEAFAEVRQMFQEQSAHFDKRLNELNDSIRRLNNAVGGDPTMGQAGIITRITALEETQKSHADKFKLLHAMWWFGGGAVAVILWLIERYSISPK